MGVIVANYGKCEDMEVTSYEMTCKGGAKAVILDRGGIVRNLFVPDRNGKLVDVVLGHATADKLKSNNCYFGAAIGRFANRIQDGKFEINGEKYSLFCNDGGNNSIHGGTIGYDKRKWDVEISGTEDAPSLVLSLLSPDGEEGFPGNLNIKMTYTLTENNEFEIHYEATTDKDTVINLTNHSYFNLAGEGSGAIDSQLIKINSSFFTPNSNTCCPTGEILSVADTPFDFREEKTFAEHFGGTHKQLEMFAGFDHNFIIDGEGYREFAKAKCKENGIVMTCYTDKPGVQLYTNNVKDDIIEGKDGAKYAHHGAFCLETQFFPNSTTFKFFPTPILRVGEKYDYKTTYAFSVEK